MKVSIESPPRVHTVGSSVGLSHASDHGCLILILSIPEARKRKASPFSTEAAQDLAIAGFTLAAQGKEKELSLIPHAVRVETIKRG